MVNWKTDLGLSVALFGLSLYVLLSARKFNETAAKFPTLIAITMMICVAFLVIFALHGKNAGGSVPARQYLHVAILAGILILYALLMSVLGFILSSLLAFAGTAVFLGARRAPTIILSDICVTGVVYVVFRFLLQVPLPAGILGF